LATVQATTYGPSLRLANAAMGVLGALGFPLTTLDRASITRAAFRFRSERDLGDPSYEVPFDQMMVALNGSTITPLARFIVRQTCIRAVQNRLAVNAYFQRYPEARDVKVERPIFVLGFPRTGTTLLQNLLSLPEDRRALQFWELFSPVPVHDDPKIDFKRRFKDAERTLAAAYFAAPEMGNVHEIRADTPEECWPLFFNSFAVFNYDLQTGIRAFGDWLLSYDMTTPYAEYRAHLQVLLHAKQAKHIVLKCPEHLWYLPALLKTFPDAAVVWTHRDPVDSVASYCSLMSLQWRNLYGFIDAERLGAHVAFRFQEGVERAMAARDAHGDPSSFFDVHFGDLVADPHGIVEAIHGHFGLDSPADMSARIDGWQANKRSDARGAHQYSATTYGLDPVSMHQDFKPYIDRFGVTLREHG
jgi:hypothetical protein